MNERNRGNQLLQRKEIESLIVYLGGNEPVPLDIALPIAERLQKYLDRELDNISQVLCSRERSNKADVNYDMGALASIAVGNIGQSQEIFDVLECISEHGLENLNHLAKQHCIDDEDLCYLKAFFAELEYDRSDGFISREKISSNKWYKCYLDFKKANE